MADYDQRHRPFDHTPPARLGSGAGLLVIGGVLLLFFLAVLFFGGTQGTTPADPGATPAIDDASVPPIAPDASSN